MTVGSGKSYTESSVRESFPGRKKFHSEDRNTQERVSCALIVQPKMQREAHTVHLKYEWESEMGFC